MNQEKVGATKGSCKTEQEQIRQDIFDYITCEMNDTDEQAEDIVNELATCKDIQKEFDTWLKTRRFPDEKEGAIVVEGYTARKLAEENRGRFEPLEVYCYLVGLRKDRENTLKMIKRRPRFY